MAVAELVALEALLAAEALGRRPPLARGEAEVGGHLDATDVALVGAVERQLDSRRHVAMPEH